LRERSGLEAIVNTLLQEEPGSEPGCMVAPEMMTLFRRHKWPGNFRQLSNLLRGAVVMAGTFSG
jgi:transcriptional regulator with PAS, ATPase and Fis domain